MALIRTITVSTTAFERTKEKFLYFSADCLEQSLRPGDASELILATGTANFLMVVSPAVLAHDVSARAGDVSMGIAVFPIGWIYLGPFEKLRDG